jgi:enoyl-CoA hydratase/carnithine racemase
MSESAAVLYEKEAGGVAVVTLNRPERLNAYDTTMRDALFEVLGAIRDDSEVRAFVLRGAGRSFCTGGDLREFGSAPSAHRAREIRWLRDVWGTLWAVPAVSIAAVHGDVVGGGFEMMMLCDLSIAAETARFALPETGLAMIPGVGGTQTTPRLIGGGRGMDLVLTGALIDAHEARRLGLVSRVVSASHLSSSALEVARRVAGIDPLLVGRLKRLVNDSLDYSLADGLERERRAAGTPPRGI